MDQDFMWQTKLAARLHDPAEKALVLLRDPAGHENGTSLALARLTGLVEPPEAIDPDNDEALVRTVFKNSLPRSVYKLIQRADWWAAAADRPQWPLDKISVPTKNGEQKTIAVAPWAQVRWTTSPKLIHPLTKDVIDLHKLNDTEIGDIKQRSFDHFSNLLVKLGAKDEEEYDWKKILLTCWRFGPELVEDEDFGTLGELWKLLPADTRVPDHSIWDHLDLTSAFAGAFAADPAGEAALLALSIGPVQGFIASARSTSDLWAGSHLLSRLAWEAMRPLCEELGPDAILFPRLRGIPQVDLWLRDTMGLPEDLFGNCEWRKGATDANPLFSAALPNRFVAVVPASRAREIAERVSSAARDWVRDTGLKVVDRLLEEGHFRQKDVPRDESIPAYRQMREQLAGFPEVHWAAVPFSLIRCRDAAKQRNLDTSALSDAMAPFFGAQPGSTPGFLDTPAWKVLGQDVSWGDGTAFFAPNPGALYPAVYDLAERVLAAAKSTRPFAQSEQIGWRCSLSGEAEWLTTNRELLTVPAGKRKSRNDRKFKEDEHVETLWTRVADAKPSWAKKGEHLGALPAIKRLWPTLFAEEVEQATGRQVGRFVVSTHAMALAKQIDDWLDKGGITAPDFSELCSEYKPDPAALPRKLMLRHARHGALADAKRIPALLDAARESDDDHGYAEARRIVTATLRHGAPARDSFQFETYYTLLMMDGDHMGAILSGSGIEKDATAIAFRDSFHPQVQKGFDERAAKHAPIDQYGKQKRPISPNRHLAISGALNDFSQIVARHVVEEEHFGRLIYAGGDDVLAMLPVADLVPAMQRLRHAYSGTLPKDESVDWGELRKHRGELHCRSGFAYLDGRLMRMMGANATASCGAVIAHHQAPLGAVLRELRLAEQRAKHEGGRNAFSITVLKRSGGALQTTDTWGASIALLHDMRDFLAAEGVSRRAVYNTLEWLNEKELPTPTGDGAMLRSLLEYQLDRQAEKRAKERHDVGNLARRLTERTLAQNKDAIKWLRDFLSVAEFLARETRTGGKQ